MDPNHDDALAGARLAVDGPALEFGDGVADDVGSHLVDRGWESALVVSDAGVAGAGVLEHVTDGLPLDTTRYEATTEPSTADFADLPSGPFDGVLAVGGGSVLDTAKVAALLLAHGGDPDDYLGEGAVPGPVEPVVAVPTTSGTGSQATQTAVLTHEGVKRGISDEALRPDRAVVDPMLTVGLPPDVTATAGFDAFVHALESLIARDYRWVPARPITYQGANPVSRVLSRRALSFVAPALERAVHDGDDLDARRRMSLGAHLAGQAFSVAGLGAVHALASAVGGMTGRPHGECLAAAIRPGLEYNRPVRREAYATIARSLGVTTDPEPNAACEALVAECVRLADAVGLPTDLTGLGLGVEDIDDIVENVLVQERRLKTNPRRVEADLADVLEATVAW